MIDDKKRLIKKDDEKELKNLHSSLKDSVYRDYFHISPLTGLLNDPNGLFFKENKFHIFYQWYPFKGIHGLKHWYEVQSPDLINFKNIGLFLKPDKIYKNRGAYSGSAFVENDDVYIVYSGNQKDENENRIPNTVLGKYENGKIIDEKVIISPNKNYKEDQRDPRIFKKNEFYYLTLGARDKNDCGCILIYRSKNINKDWEFFGELEIKDFDNKAYMWECPDILKVDEKDVLLFSPQGMKACGEFFNNIYQNGYIIGKLDIENKIFYPESEFIELDRGFDFYAAQSFSNTEKSYLIGWIGLPDTIYPNDKEFSGNLSLVRELKIKYNKLFINPVKNIDDLRLEKIEFNKIVKSIEPLEISLDNIENSLQIKVYSQEKNGGFIISYDKNKKEFKIDRSKLENKISQDFGFERKISDVDLKSMKIYVDKSTIEIFINQGEYALTSKVFPKNKEKDLYIKGLSKENTQIYTLKKSYIDNFSLNM
ncbi:sucrose-6-phosphate hydrolase [Anaerococcus hydrogenalis]|uniref:Sucrose-6-phosphate hydrolase n=1 Tax=Anaerococcus hydrogenalis TaxID=33029 RepID=A0A2N6UKG0_9FIRM|nr:sucrose-6-phosphate hydrolase [Anaerococcus hydrogenalis]MDK7694223.1 sucrose-6-phosphate hydrolase [Anaerococcus hydrogenalis]MDK7696001.1 sucrose-6-phosphate hydrolase [Anaerococcus hydrogenalis]MDK7707250.1 sucrose-6-phosphate hydrolase [Anaerococcus hydrogenalis]PMC82276.1 sucrose-6-phosphate hydrolase [Anaerococcus hydrogenalis]